MTIEQARIFVNEHYREGCECPCCGLFVKAYKRKLNSGQVVVLAKLWRASRGAPEWLHITQFLNLKPIASNRDYSYMTHWGLIEKKAPDPKQDKKCSGFWRITDKGSAFVRGEIRVPRHIHLLDNEFLGFSDETIDVREALSDKFQYSELMAA